MVKVAKYFRIFVYYSDRMLRITISLFFGGIVILSFYAPVTQHINNYPAGEEIYSLFNPICHQYPTRSFWLFNRPTALCARCVSGYLGVFLASIFIRLRIKYRYRLLIGIGLLLIAIIDPILQLNSSYESANAVRFLSGLIGGISVFLIIYPFTYFKGEKNEINSLRNVITDTIQ